MANIVDRLITYVEYRGIRESVSGLGSVGSALESFRTASIKVVDAQKRMFEAQTALNKALNNTSGFKNSLNYIYRYNLRLRDFQNAALDSLQAIMNFQKIMAATAVIGAAGFLVLEGVLVRINKQYEEMQARLSGLYNSGQIGLETTNFLRAYSSRGPFSFGQNAQDAVRLLAEGIKPTEKALRVTQGVGFVQNMSPADIARVIGRAALGQTRSLRQLGVGMEDIRRYDPSNVVGRGQFKNVEKAQQDILDLLSKRYGNTLKYMDDLTASHTNRMKNSFFNMLEDLDRLTGASGWFKRLMDDFSRLFFVIDKVLIALQFIFGGFIHHGKTLRDEFLGLSKPGDVPPWLKHANVEGGGMSNIVREVLGGGAIAKLGIKASELPGIGGAKRNTIKVDVSHAGDQDLKKFLEKLLAEFYSQAVKHNAIPT